MRLAGVLVGFRLTFKSSLIRYLSSDEASFITGETVNINGGYYMD
jgi:hypothetical protein